MCSATVPVGVASMEGVISEGSEMADATGRTRDKGEGDTRDDGGS